MNEHLYSLGIDAWWMDASEPNVQDNTDIEYRKALCGPTYLGPSTKYFTRMLGERRGDLRRTT